MKVGDNDDKVVYLEYKCVCTRVNAGVCIRMYYLSKDYDSGTLLMR